MINKRQDSQDNNKATQKLNSENKRRRLEIVTGLLVCLIILITGYIIFAPKNSADSNLGVGKAQTIAAVNMKEATKSHPRYLEILELEEKERSLRLDLEQGLERATLEVDAPKSDAAPFDDSVWQKNAQELITGRISLERRRKELKTEFQQKTEPSYIERRQKLEEEYLNDILNYNLKLDNQRAMHGFRVSEEELLNERKAWESELSALKEERLARHIELYNDWQAEIEALVSAAIAPEEAAWQAKVNITIDEQKKAADKLKKEVDSRNKEAVARVNQGLFAKSRAEKMGELDDIRLSIAKIKEDIRNDIESLATKIALKNRLELVLARTPSNEKAKEKNAPGLSLLSTPNIVYGENILDITTKISEELQKLAK